MNTFVVHTEETEHSGDLERYARAMASTRKVIILGQRYPLMGEYETGEITVQTSLDSRGLQAVLDANEETEGLCFVSRRA